MSNGNARWLLVAVLGCLAPGRGGVAQSGSTAIPPTAATRSVSDLPSAQPVSQASRSGANAEVRWTGALLSIRAGGQSLPDLLRQVARATGMKISGSAPVEPVYGTYGPAPVQQVMAQLFDGLSVNMLLVNDGSVKPKELVLTARTGGASPPSAMQSVSAGDDNGGTNPADSNLVQLPHPGRHTSPNSFQGGDGGQNSAGSQAGNAGTQGGGTGAQAMQPLVGIPAGPPVPLNDAAGDSNTSTAPATDANGTPQSPNGVRTPEQIFEELRRRQQGASQ